MMPATKEHLLILGASGISGVALINEVLELGEAGPLLTLYVRPSGRGKLPKTIHDKPSIRVIEGALDDRDKLIEALSPSSNLHFPKVTTVISVLGAYMSLYYFLTRQKPTPIADAFNSTILPAMDEVGVRRIFALSTASGFTYPEESANMSWGWWLSLLMPPKIIVPQGDAEMRGIANAVVAAGARDSRLEWTIFRVGFLTDDKADTPISAGEIAKDYNGTGTLARSAMSRWILGELERRKHVRRAPMLGDAAKSGRRS